MTAYELFHTKGSEQRYNTALAGLRPRMRREDVETILGSVCQETFATLLFDPTGLSLSVINRSQTSVLEGEYHI